MMIIPNIYYVKIKIIQYLMNLKENNQKHNRIFFHKDNKN